MCPWGKYYTVVIINPKECRLPGECRGWFKELCAIWVGDYGLFFPCFSKLDHTFCLYLLSGQIKAVEFLPDFTVQCKGLLSIAVPVHSYSLPYFQLWNVTRVFNFHLYSNKQQPWNKKKIWNITIIVFWFSLRWFNFCSLFPQIQLCGISYNLCWCWTALAHSSPIHTRINSYIHTHKLKEK